MNFAIMGLGHIAGKMAETVQKIPGVICYAVASRSAQKARDFANKWNFIKCYGSYEEMLEDDLIDLIYIATPHSAHYENAKMCILKKKNILVEKAFATNYKEAYEIISLARMNNVLVSEAIWTRYMPSRLMVEDALRLIGKVYSLEANLGYNIKHVERLTNPALAGGALLDLGVYTLNFALMFIKEKIVDIKANAILENGVDLQNNISIVFENNIMATLHSTMMNNTNRLGLICGEKGYIEVININNCEEINVYNNEHMLVKKYEIPKQITGYEYEVLSCMRAIENNILECVEMPHEETLRIMKIMDEIRYSWHMYYPNEK